MQDNTIEYLIVTHAHQDHIAALVGSDGKGIFDHYKIKNIIQFSLTNQDKTKGLYKEYLEKRDEEVRQGANLYFANDLIKNKINIFNTISNSCFVISINCSCCIGTENTHSYSNYHKCRYKALLITS